MRGAVLAALAATMGNLLQGWDVATIAGATLYIKEEFDLDSQPTLEGLILATSLIGATFITAFAGSVSDKIGRRMILVISSILFLLSSLVLMWSPNVYVLLVGRLLDGFGVGISVTIIPVYISETAPSEIRGQLNTLPQFNGVGGMFLAYLLVFGMSFLASPSWRLMFGALGIPAIFFLALMVFYLPESPRWLVSKGRMEEAKQVLHRLRAKEDVTAEMALLVEGLGTGGETSIEEYVIGGDQNDEYTASDKNHITMYGPEQGQSWIARPITEQSTVGMISHHGSIANQSTSFIDPVVTLFGSVHEKLPQSGSMLFPNFGSMFNAGDDQQKNESSFSGGEGEDYASDRDDLRSPLLSTENSVVDKDSIPPSGGNSLNVGDIGGGWQLAYKYTETTGRDGKTEHECKRIFLHQDDTLLSGGGSIFSLHGEAVAGNAPEESQLVQASALVSRSALKINVPTGQGPVREPGTVQPSESVTKGPSLRELLEPGVKHALIVGMGLQILQQLSGTSGVLFYTTEILDQAGVGTLLSSFGLSSASADLLLSAVSTLLMLPSLIVPMKLVDVSGRRFLLLHTIPILIVSLLVLIISNVFDMGDVLQATLSTVGLLSYFCVSCMGFAPIPNIMCSEIFPTRVRGLCIALCSMTYWIGDIIVTYSLSALLSSIGLAGVFGIFAILCTISWFFVYLKVPETMGMPLEVISEMFNVGAKQAQNKVL